MKRIHLAILKKRYVAKILDGSKTIESRLTKTRREPFGRIEAGDKILLKQTAGPIVATAAVKAVKQFSDLTPNKIKELREKYNSKIKADDDYWLDRLDCKFMVLVWLECIKPIEPVWIEKKDWRAWVVLSEKSNYGLMKKSI